MNIFETIFADEEGEFWQQKGEGGHLAGHIGKKSPRKVATEQEICSRCENTWVLFL